MEYSNFLDLDPLQIYLCAFERYLRQNALQVSGGAIIANEIHESEAGKYYFSLSKVQLKAHKGAYITARQVYEYTERHGGNIVAEYMQASLIYNAYGYIMYAAASAIHGAEYAAQWLQKWQEGKPAALAVFYNAAQCDAKQGKYIRACLDSLRDIDKEPQPLEEYADLEQMQTEAERIAQQVGKQTARTCEYESDGDIIRNAILPTFKGFGGGMDYVPALKAAISDIMGDRRKGGKRGAAAVLLAAYDTIVNTKMLSFVAWLELWGITDKGNYKRAKLRPADYMTKALKECPELQRILYP